MDNNENKISICELLLCKMSRASWSWNNDFMKNTSDHFQISMFVGTSFILFLFFSFFYNDQKHIIIVIVNAKLLMSCYI